MCRSANAIDVSGKTAFSGENKRLPSLRSGAMSTRAFRRDKADGRLMQIEGQVDRLGRRSQGVGDGEDSWVSWRSVLLCSSTADPEPDEGNRRRSMNKGHKKEVWFLVKWWEREIQDCTW